ncbi:hypothetical protein Y032_0293g1614 [Ancylostoma ceylanicum]|uniref:Uncharacterized protein n=1 Tax=Ancylostoma ceylanicum TaxID=53326 RepID=A0A016S4V3_9BILA|nr:hypothetical protein Y032_0293g1614 [Ancylostoma ceylanicum]
MEGFRRGKARKIQDKARLCSCFPLFGCSHPWDTLWMKLLSKELALTQKTKQQKAHESKQKAAEHTMGGSPSQAVHIKPGFRGDY